MNEEKINLEEHNEDAFVSIKEKKKKISLRRECCAYGCSNTFYNSDGLLLGYISSSSLKRTQENNCGVT